jgi:hypothetical protein
MITSNSSIAIVLPYYKDELSSDEQFSLRHLDFFLSAYQRIVVKPVSLQKIPPGCEALSFPDHYFASVAAYSDLLLSPSFYEAFSAFDYILIYQLDCLVFSSDLEKWCQDGYDYIGAPFFRDKSDPTRGFSRVGNGGLSLRRVDSFLKVLNTSYIPSWRNIFSIPMPDLYQFPWPYRWLKKLRVFRDARREVKWYTHHYSLNEDLFWSDRAKLFSPDFKIAPIEMALRFAFEAHPRYCFELNNWQLPFGVHAWTKCDRVFWEPFVQKEN